VFFLPFSISPNDDCVTVFKPLSQVWAKDYYVCSLTNYAVVCNYFYNSFCIWQSCNYFQLITTISLYFWTRNSTHGTNMP